MPVKHKAVKSSGDYLYASEWNDYHDVEIQRSEMEYPTEDVNFAYLFAIEKAKWGRIPDNARFGLLTKDSFTDLGVERRNRDRGDCITRAGGYEGNVDRYRLHIATTFSTADLRLDKVVSGTYTCLAYESVDLDDVYHHVKLTSSGSTHKGYREDMTTAKISATDTEIASGYFGSRYRRDYSSPSVLCTYLRPASSSLPKYPAKAIIELEVIGYGTEEEPFTPNFEHKLVEIGRLTNLPDFLYREYKKYDLLRRRGFSDEEIELLLGYIPQRHVDLLSVSWGAFDHKGEGTMIVVITGDNPYRFGAIQNQVEYARSRNLLILKPPKNYREAVEQYKIIKSRFPEKIAGKDNYAYQTLGFDEIGYLANVDFYYGAMIEGVYGRKALKDVPDWFIRKRLDFLYRRVCGMRVLADEREKHIKKIEEIKRQGW